MSNDKDLRIYKRADCAVFRKTAEAFGGLSNMAPGFPVRINGVRILTVEALYQACRFPHLPDVQRKIIAQTSPMTAKMVGKPYRDDSRPDWDRVRVKIMRWVLRLKLAMHWTQFSALLLFTGDMPIVEDSRKDDFWGAMPTDAATLVGMNVLGRLLMELREEIKQGVELRRVEPPAIPELLLFDEVMGVVDFRDNKSKPYSVEVETIHHAVHDFSTSLFPDTPVDMPAQQARGDAVPPSAERRSSIVAVAKPYSVYVTMDCAVKTGERGIPWLDAMPAHWKVLRSKRLFNARKERAQLDDEQLSATQAYGVIPQKEYELRVGRKVVRITQHLEKRAHVEKDDFVISMRSFQGGLERAWEKGCIRSSYVVLNPAPETNVAYFAHLFKSIDYIRALQATSNFIRDGQDLNFANFCMVDLPLPPMDEQVAMAKFLGYVNRKIDGFIRAKRKLIGLLNEQKQAIICRAVIGGLSTNVQRKPSHIPFLGEIPAHWETPLNRHIFRENIRHHKGKFERQLSLSQRDGLIATDDMKERSLQTSSYDNWKVTVPGDLVLNRFKAHLGVFFASTLRGIVSFHYGVFAPQRVLNTKYFELLFHTAPFRTIYAGRSNGMTIGLQNLSNQNFYGVRSIVPPIEEQDEIVAYVETATADLNAIISRAEREIALMQEYRTRLTADVVTGKLDVREAAATVPELAADTKPEPIAEEALEEFESEEV